MKIRNAFVSNSSSCSFIILGVKIQPPADLDDWEDRKRDDWYDNHWHIEGNGGLYFLAGKVLAKEVNDGELEDVDFSMAELHVKAGEIAREHKVDPAEIRLFVGTRMC